AFGEIESQSGTTENTYRFTGEQFDPSLDQYYLRDRYMDTAVGRFMRMDVWEGRGCSPLTLNKYLYSDSNPAANVDPLGLFSMGQLNGAMNAIGNLARTASTNFARGAVRQGWKAARKSGELAQSWVKRIVEK